MDVILENWLGQVEGAGSVPLAWAENLRECRKFAKEWVRHVTPPTQDDDYISLVACEIPHYTKGTSVARKKIQEVILLDSKDGTWVIP